MEFDLEKIVNKHDRFYAKMFLDLKDTFDDDDEYPGYYVKSLIDGIVARIR